MRWAGLLLLGCGSGPEVATPSAGGASAGTPGGVVVGTPTGTVTETDPNVQCDVRPDNVLIFDCVAETGSVEPAAAYLELPNGSLRTIDSEQSGERLEFSVWRLNGETEYAVRVAGASGSEIRTEITTGVIPPEHDLAPVITGTPSFTHLLVPHQCSGGPNLLLLDAAGEVVWYLEVGAGMTGVPSAAVDGFDDTPDGVVAVLGRYAVREWTWTQEPVLDLRWPGALPSPVHHDVVHKQGRTYVLTADEYTGLDGSDYVVDGFAIYDPAGVLVGKWDYTAHFEPTGAYDLLGGFWGTIFPGSWDWAHSNGLEVDVNGDILISSRTFSTVLKLDGDWTTADFGHVQWALATNPDGELGSDFSFDGTVAPQDFRDQHHPNFDTAGRLLMFDNRSFSEPSRATRWQLDQLGLVATLEAAWSMGEPCSVQGSVYPAGADGVVATCPSSQTVHEFSPAQAEPVWSIDLQCASTPNAPLVVRGMPLDFDP